MKKRESMKIVVLILANDEICTCGKCIREGRASSYTPMVKACRDTWASNFSENIKYYYIYGHRKGIDFPIDSKEFETMETYWPNGGPRIGGKPQNVLKKLNPFAIGDCIYSDTPEGRENIYYKTMDAFQWLVQNEEFDYVLRTNCGTYVDMDLLQTFIKNLDKKHSLYCGVSKTFNNQHNTTPSCSQIKFASGSAFLASRDLIEDIVENRESVEVVRGSWLSKTIIDDVTFGHRFLNVKQANFVPWSYKEATSIDHLRNNVANVMQIYFGHTIEPKLIYATHKEKLIAGVHKK